MAVSRAMRRLRQVRQMEEELCQAALESAVSDLGRIETALKCAQERERAGRRQVTASAATGEVIDRVAGLEETRTARRHAEMLRRLIAEQELVVAARRAGFLARRMERRQVETLIENGEALETIKSSRRGQRELDDWFLGRAQESEAEES
jgi:hypothetical protein